MQKNGQRASQSGAQNDGAEAVDSAHGIYVRRREEAGSRRV